jgi:hypothetical protein
MYTKKNYKKLSLLIFLAFLLSTIFVGPALGDSGSFGYTTWAGANTVNDVSYFGQAFTPTENISVTSARLWVMSAAYSASRTVKVAIRSDMNGTNLGESNPTSVPVFPNWGLTHDSVDFNFSTPVNLTAGTKYYLVISSTNGDLCYRFVDNWANVPGNRLTGSSPTGYSNDTGDLMFEIFYTTNNPPDVTNALPSVETIWNPNNKLVDVNILGVTDPDGDPVTITINSITSDETTGTIEGAGGNVHAPDAIINADGSFQLRAERSGLGDGRVYIISFTADDGKGGVTTGSVTVGVPHEANGNAVDSRGVSDVPSDGYDATVFN